jgi:hypothetical protein
VAFPISAHGFIDLRTVAPVVRRQRHHRVVQLGRDHERAIDGLLGPTPTTDQKRLSSVPRELSVSPMMGLAPQGRPPTKSPRQCWGCEFVGLCENSVLRQNCSRIELVIEPEQHLVGGEILVTGDVRIEATNRNRNSRDESADGGNAAEAEVCAGIL